MTVSRSSIQLVPEDLVIKIIKLAKEGKADEVFSALELTRELPAEGLNVELVRRLITLAVLEPEGLTGQDVVWMKEMEKVKKVFLGVWQARVRMELVVAGWLLLCSGVKLSDDAARLAVNSLADQISDARLVDWLIKKLPVGAG